MKNKTKQFYICRGHSSCKANSEGRCPHAKPHTWVHDNDIYLGCNKAMSNKPSDCDCIRASKLKVMLENL